MRRIRWARATGNWRLLINPFRGSITNRHNPSVCPHCGDKTPLLVDHESPSNMAWHCYVCGKRWRPSAVLVRLPFQDGSGPRRLRACVAPGRTIDVVGIG